MSYCGKSIDGFDYAFRALLIANGCNELPEISFDCISFRSFAFSVTDKINNCFSPSIKWEEYFRNLIKYLGLEKVLWVEKLSDFSLEHFPEDKWVLLGESPVLLENESLQRIYYSGCPSYILCRVLHGKIFLMSNASMIPAQYVSRDQLQKVIDSGKGFAAYFKYPPELILKDLNMILWDAVEWRDNNPGFCLRNHSSSIDDFQFSKGKNKYSLQYGIMNYQLQVNKTLEFAHRYGFVDSIQYRELLEKLRNLPDVIDKNQYSLIYELDTELWNYISFHKKEK